MNRRNFFTWIAAAIGWLWGAKPQQQISAESLLKMKARLEKPPATDKDGGFIVPGEFVPMILSQTPLLGKAVVIDVGETPTLAEVCRARGIDIDAEIRHLQKPAVDPEFIRQAFERLKQTAGVQ